MNDENRIRPPFGAIRAGYGSSLDRATSRVRW